MNSQEPSGTNAEFRIQDPIQVFDTFSTEEIIRRHQTDPEFDASLHQEAKELILSRLRTQRFDQESMA